MEGPHMTKQIDKNEKVEKLVEELISEGKLRDTGERGVSEILMTTNADGKTYRTGEIREGRPIYKLVGPKTIQEATPAINEIFDRYRSSEPTSAVPWKVRNPLRDDPAEDRCAQCDAEPDGREYTLPVVIIVDGNKRQKFLGDDKSHIQRGGVFACLHACCWQFFRPTPYTRYFEEVPYKRYFKKKCTCCSDQPHHFVNFHDEDWFCRTCFEEKYPNIPTRVKSP
jgi:hypothetical protein